MVGGTTCKSVFNVSLQILGVNIGRSSPDDLAVCANEESLPVPRDVALPDWRVEANGLVKRLDGRRALSLEISIQRVLFVSIHIDFPKHLEVGDKAIARTDVFHAVQDLSGCRTRFLM